MIYNLINSPKAELINSHSLKLRIDSEYPVYVSRLSLWSLPVSSDISYKQRNVRIVATISSEQTEYKKPLSCFSFSHPNTGDVDSIYIVNKFAMSDVILSVNNDFKESILIDYFSDLPAKDLYLSDFKFIWKC